MDCKNCEHAIFDEQWGEYKCRVRQHRVYKPGKDVTCEWYKKGTPSPSVNDDVMND